MSLWRILLVEDDEDDFVLIRDLLAEFLGQEFQLAWCPTFAEGLEALSVEVPDVALIDYCLGAEDGLELIRRARAQGCRTPLILLTGQRLARLDSKALEAGAVDYIAKDELSAERLERALRYAVERHRAQEDLRRRDAVLAAMTYAAGRLLSGRNWAQGIQEVLRRLAEAMGIDFAFLIRYETDGNNALLGSLIQHWTRPGLSSGLDLSQFDCVSVEETGFGRWARVMGERGVIAAQVSDLPQQEQRYLAAVGVQSILQVPVLVEERLWGAIGMSTVAGPRQWKPGEVEAMQTAANLLGAAIARHQVQASLAESEARYRAIVEDQRELICRWKPDGTLTFVNRAYAEFYGLYPEDLNGQTFWPHIYPADTPRLQAHIQDLTAGEAPGTILHRAFRRDGSLRWLEWTDRPIRNEEGDIVEFQSVGRDVTERMQREREREAILNVAAALRQALSSQEMAPILLEQVSKWLEAEAASLALRDRETGESVSQLAVGSWARLLAGKRLPPGEGVVGRTIARGEPVVVNDAAGDPHVAVPETLEGLRALACVPLVAEGETLGALCVGRKTPLTEQEVGLLTAIADMAASALRRATLHEQTERRLQYLQALRSIDHAISTQMDLRTTLDILLDQVREKLSVDAADVLLSDPDSGALVFVAGAGFRARPTTGPLTSDHDPLLRQALLEQHVLSIRDLRQLDPEDTTRRPLFAQEDFVFYAAAPLVTRGQPKGVLEVFHRSPFSPHPEWHEFLQALGTQAAIALENARLFQELQRANEELQQAYEATLEGWVEALDLRDNETEGHTRRVTELTLQLARAMGIREPDLAHVRRGALLHDIGKMGVPDSILRKPGPLSDHEWDIMRRHPRLAYEWLSKVPYLRPALEIPLCHHEKWDGSGYPRGLKGEEIPLAARIFAVVDVWDALTSDRPYRPAWEEPRALAYLRKHAGRHFDPQIVELFLTLKAQGKLEG